MKKTTTGFTIVELIIVIVVIAILATIGYVSYNGARDRAYQARIRTEAYSLKEAIEIARNKTQGSLRDVTGSYWSGQYCLFQYGTGYPGTPIPNNTDFSVQNAMTQQCWTDSLAALQAISTASGVDVTGFRDPWGRPYYIDENEAPAGNQYQCSSDAIGWLSRPYTGGYTQNWPLELNIPPFKPLCYS